MSRMGDYLIEVEELHTAAMDVDDPAQLADFLMERGWKSPTEQRRGVTVDISPVDFPLMGSEATFELQAS